MQRALGLYSQEGPADNGFSAGSQTMLYSSTEMRLAAYRSSLPKTGLDTEHVVFSLVESWFVRCSTASRSL